MTRRVARRAIRFALVVLAAAAATFGAQAADADCKAVDTKYPHGVAKDFRVIKTASGLSGRPFVSAKLYAQLKRKGEDRDHDGVDCER
jgi:hypothetical protein